jgi:hypothetical protein
LVSNIPDNTKAVLIHFRYFLKKSIPSPKVELLNFIYQCLMTFAIINTQVTT